MKSKKKKTKSKAKVKSKKKISKKYKLVKPSEGFSKISEELYDESLPAKHLHPVSPELARCLQETAHLWDPDFEAEEKPFVLEQKDFDRPFWDTDPPTVELTFWQEIKRFFGFKV